MAFKIPFIQASRWLAGVDTILEIKKLDKLVGGIVLH